MPDVNEPPSRAVLTVETAEQAGGKRSEDVVRVLPNAITLLDGATSLRPSDRNGGWYAARLSDALGPRLTTDADLTDLLADAIADVATTHGLVPGDAPSSTVAMLRWDDHTVEALVLADSPVVVFTTSGVHPVTDERLANLTSGERGYRDRLRQGGGFNDEHSAQLGEAMRVTHRWRNVDGGFWVAEAEPAAARHAVRARFSRSEATAAILASDGVSCGVTDYEIYSDWSAVLDEAVSATPHSVLNHVRAAELSDPDGQRWPRPKRHDDQALVVVRF